MTYMNSNSHGKSYLINMSKTKNNEKLTQLSKNASQQIVEEKTGASEQKFENQREESII